MIKAEPRIQAGLIDENGVFQPLTEYEPFASIWEAYAWLKSREGNPDGWTPAYQEYWEVVELPEPVVHTLRGVHKNV